MFLGFQGRCGVARRELLLGSQPSDKRDISKSRVFTAIEDREDRFLDASSDIIFFAIEVNHWPRQALLNEVTYAFGDLDLGRR